MYNCMIMEKILEILYVEDVCRAIKLCMYNSRYKIVNIGSGIPYKFRTLMQYVKDKVGSKSNLISVDPPLSQR